MSTSFAARIMVTGLLACLMPVGGPVGGPAQAQDGLLTAEESDPRVMGWMQGTPVPEDRLVTVGAGNFFDFPRSRWTVCHIRDLFPTVDVSRGLGPVIPLAYAPHHEFADLRAGIDALTFTPVGSDTTMTWAEALSAHGTDIPAGLRGGRGPSDDQELTPPPRHDGGGALARLFPA
ncbi:MAG: hypothetical protein MUF73_08580 [Rhodobacteraceae bacterium]|jgi:hypothetical protein|nr:hypothetical protein [Paracoccaceae bacterium]